MAQGVDPNDIYHNGSWYSRAGWSAESQSIVNNTYPFIVPSSGSVTVTTGAIALTTALDRVYAKCYMYFPANVFTSSSAGWYYCEMSTTSAGLMYSNTYTTGIPADPTSKTLVTTGAGAYTQTTGAYLGGQIFTIPGNAIALDGKAEIETICKTNATANFKYVQHCYGTTDLTGMGLTTATVTAAMTKLVNVGATNKQCAFTYNGMNSGATDVTTKDSTAAQTLQIKYYLATATDWIAFQWHKIRTFNS